MGAQGGGGSDAQNVADPGGPAPVEHLGAAIMAVSAQSDRGFGPVRPDRAQKTAQERPDFRAFDFRALDFRTLGAEVVPEIRTGW